MKTVTEFSEGARALAKNPLGVIALFIVLIYGFAALVTGLGNNLNGYERWTLVLFLALFPVGVLTVFTFLVACHHEKLYGPGDYPDAATLTTMWMLGRDIRVPEDIRRSRTEAAVTSDSEAPPSPSEDNDRLNTEYAGLLDTGFCLLHTAQMVQERGARPKSARYNVRVWIEPIGARRLADIASVSYRLWDDFEPSIHTTKSQATDFDLWLSAYGEFPVLALLRFKDGRSAILQRYLDLPGRPAD